MTYPYREHFADAGRAWKPGPPLTAEQERELHKRNSEEQERWRAARARHNAQTRADWKLTVGRLKTIIADLPDDMPVVVWGELGIVEPAPTVDAAPYEIAGPVLDMGGGC